eukprot:12147950-Ditylum_brightwellii.AAC.1
MSIQEGRWAVPTSDTNMTMAPGARRTLTRRQGRLSLSDGRVTKKEVDKDNEKEVVNDNDPYMEPYYAIILALGDKYRF